MDRNQAIGLILISLLVIVYFQFFAPTPQPLTGTERDTIEVEVKEEPQIQDPVISALPEISQDSSAIAAEMGKLGPFSTGLEGNEEEIQLENDNILITFSTKGASIRQVILKEYLTYEKEPLILLDEESSRISLIAKSRNGDINLDQLYYKASKTTREDTTVVKFRLAGSDGSYLDHIFELPSKGFRLTYRIETSGTAAFMDSRILGLNWNYDLKRTEFDLTQSRNNTTINYYDTEGEFDDLSPSSSDPEEASPGNGIKWLSFKQRFFSAAIISKDPLTNLKATTRVPEDSSTVKIATASFNLPIEEKRTDILFWSQQLPDHEEGDAGIFKKCITWMANGKLV